LHTASRSTQAAREGRDDRRRKGFEQNDQTPPERRSDMKPALLAVTILLCLSACDRGLKVGPAAETRLPTDTSMIQHENQTNKSFTPVGIGMESPRPAWLVCTLRLELDEDLSVSLLPVV